MFGFLKKKLQDAVSKFSKKASEEVKEEKVEDQVAIKAAKQEEEKLIEAAAAEVKVVPELPKEREQHEREARERPAKETSKEKPKAEKKQKEKPKAAPKAKKKAEKKAEEKKAEKKGFLGVFKKKEKAPEAAKATPEEPVAKPTPKKLIEKEPIKEPIKIREEKPEKKEVGKAPEEAEKELPEKKNEPVLAEPIRKRTILGRLKETFTKKTLSEKKFEELFWDLEVALLENNVAVEVIEKLKADLKKALTSGKVTRMGIEDLILVSLKESVREVLDVPGFDLVKRVKESRKRPYVIAFIGVNGSGKTTTLAKVANRFQQERLSVVMAASDTFRAAAIDQLKEHADKLGVKLISQGYGADPAAVAFDAVEHAKARGIDVVMIDTAGRLHSNTNLMAELQKVIRVANPDLKIFIGESITGNDCIEQAKEFDRLAGIDAIILSKADVDEKGGAALSVSYVTKKPILYLGVGQAYGDMKPFDKELVLQSLGL